MQTQETVKAQSGEAALNSSEAHEIETLVSYSNVGARLLLLGGTWCIQMKLCLSVSSGGVEGRAYRAARGICK